MGTNRHHPDLDERALKEVVRRALEEDRAGEDITTALLGEGVTRPGVGRFRAEEPLVVAGLVVVERTFRELDSSCVFTPEVRDGDRVASGRVLATVRGRTGVLLGAERVALNFLQHLSAVATKTRAAVDAVRGTDASITDTRKTVPGLRFLEKYAVRVGGGVSHRLSLGDAVLWKDNHWALLGGTGQSLSQAVQAVPTGVPVIVEVETEAQLDQALAAGVRRILVDNRSPERVAAWVRRAGPEVAIEASGGITPELARPYAEAGAKFISMGCLTHSVRAVGISFEIVLDG
jgi:nicotinate-nucleotide pyrophosphorylase (carboxylating)